MIFIIYCRTCTCSFVLHANCDALAANDFVVKNPSGDTLIASIDYTVSVSGTVVTITLINPEDGEYTVATVSSPKYIFDNGSGSVNTTVFEDGANKIAVIQETEVTVVAP